MLSDIYLENYEIIMNDFMIDDQEQDVSIANLSVQIFTVPSVAHNLIENHDALTKMIELFTKIFEDEVKYVDGQLDLSDWMDERTSEYERSTHILSDIQYILSTTPNASTWSVKMRKNFVKGVQALINLIGKLQLADPQGNFINIFVLQKSRQSKSFLIFFFSKTARQTGAHVEYESRNWLCVFNIAAPLMRIAHLAKQWCKEDLTVLKPISK